MVISGVDTIVDIASTGTTIILGENNKVTMAANDLKDIVGPIVSIAGGVNVFSGDSIKAGIKAGAEFSKQMGSLDKLNYIGETVLDLVSEGKILGGTITVGGDGETTVTMTEISTEGKTSDEVAKELKEAGLPVPEEGEPKTAAELAVEIEEEYYYTEEELNEVIENLRNLLYEMFLDSEESTAPPAEAIGGLSIDEIVGIYDVTLKSDWPEGPREQATEIKFVKRDGQLEIDKGLFVLLKKMPFDFDWNTNTATCTYERQDGTTTTETFVFTKEKGNIYVSGTSTGSAGTVYFEGCKVD